MATDANRADPRRRRLFGALLAGLAAVFASSAGVLLRSVESADAWTILVYRSLGYVALMLVVIALVHRGSTLMAFRKIGKAGVVAAVALGVAFVCFILALTSASVASVVAILGSAPLMAALMGLAYLGERPGPAGWLAIVLAGGGVGFVVLGEASLGGGLGLLFGGIACFGYAATVVALRAGAEKDMTPALCLSGVFAGLVALAMADTLEASRNDVLIGLTLGVGQIGLQYLLIGFATRFAPASDVALIMVAEIVLAPLWVWIVYAEQPTTSVLIGLAIVILALLLNTLADRRGAEPPH